MTASFAALPRQLQPEAGAWRQERAAGSRRAPQPEAAALTLPLVLPGTRFPRRREEEEEEERERHGPGGRAAVTDPAPLRCAPAGGCAAPSRGRATSLRLGVRGRDAAARTMSWLSGSRGVVLTAYHPSGGTGG